MTRKRLLTGDHLFALGPDERGELVKGVLVAMRPTGFLHGRVVATLTALVAAFVQRNRLGYCCGTETGFYLHRNPDTVRAPDFAFVARGRITPDMDLTCYFELAPDFVAEVASPVDTAPQLAARAQEYLAAGVRLVWTVWPQQRAVEVARAGVSPLRVHADGVLTGEDVLPGFSCRVADLFDADDA